MARGKGNVLFLGNSESVGEFADLFSTANRKWKLYRRKEDVVVHRPLMNFPRPPAAVDAHSATCGNGLELSAHTRFEHW